MQQKKEPHLFLAGKAPNWLCLVFEIEGEATFFHSDKAAARLTFVSIEKGFKRQAGVLIALPFLFLARLL